MISSSIINELIDRVKMKYQQILLVIIILANNLCFADYCSKNDCSPKTYMVTENGDPKYELVRPNEGEEAIGNRCWKYTWV